MYDFLLLTPHGTGSHSLINYLNQHHRLQVAPAYNLTYSDVGIHERELRPWIDVVGVSVKHYARRTGAAPVILAATKRNVLIQTVRDPIECFVSNYRSAQFGNTLIKLLRSDQRWSPLVPEEMVATSINEYITHAAAEDAYEASSFASHILIDVAELRGDGSEIVTKRLWDMLAGDSNVENAVFKPLGSMPFHMLRSLLYFDFNPEQTNVGPIPITFRLEGDLEIARVDWVLKKTYSAYETYIHTYKAEEMIPNCNVSGSLHLCTMPSPWTSLHPVVRQSLLDRSILPLAARILERFNDAYGVATAETTFSMDDLPKALKDTLKAGLEKDFTIFDKRHPEITARWKTTQSFLGS